MTKCAPPGWRLFLVLFLAFSFLGCSPFKRDGVSEEKDPHFLEGKKRGTGMDWDGAIQSFERALQSNPTNAAAHFELGLLFDRHKNDFGAAIYHYQRYLTLRTNSPLGEMARTSVLACKRQLANEVSYTLVPRDFQKELERFNLTNSLLKQQVDALQAELARRPQYVTNYFTNLVQVQMPQFDPRGSGRLTQPTTLVPPTVEPVNDPPVVRPDPSAVRNPPAAAVRRNERADTARKAPAPTVAATPGPRKTHRVRPGDTLDVVARTYGVSVSALKAANPGARNGARAGQQLVIPEK